MEAPDVKYVKNGDVHIAYATVGDGPFDLVFVGGWVVTNFLSAWDGPPADTLRRLASFSRLILFDKRGTGLSDRSYGLPDYETRMDDIRAVMDAVGSERAAVLGVSEGGPLTLLFAATHPDRVAAAVLYSTTSTFVGDDDHPWQPTVEERLAWIEPERARFGTDDWFDEFFHGLSPSIADDPQLKRWWRRWVLESTSPGALAELRRVNLRLDARHVLPSIGVPTLVLHPVDDTDIPFECGRYIAAHVPGAQFVELPGPDHGWWVRPDQIGDHAERFLTELWERGEWDAVEPDRVLATVLFTDIVGSTEKLAQLGDRGWRELIGEHHVRVRRQLARYRGREIDTAGDGFFAAFDGPARAIRCACAITETVRDLGIDVRAGLHTGECEQLDGKVGGIAVHIGARVAANAGPGEVVVSRTVRDLVSGSGIEFEERGSVELKGVPGRWELFAVA
ncbi:MAG TPA: adenylate/guanylate cyclase domain-containing protein [Gaiellaceae bacterium]|nr:adenylate/guanylate cyclase domain-containing protein [Gaiellaceae bacterium]